LLARVVGQLERAQVSSPGELALADVELQIRVVLTGLLEDESIVGAVRAGAVGYLLKDTRGPELRQAIKAAAVGQDELILDFYRSTCEVGATLAGWDRAGLERPDPRRQVDYSSGTTGQRQQSPEAEGATER
jgi:hypothetical protein